MIRGRRIAGERGEGRKRWLLFECGCKFTKHCVTKQDKLAVRTLMQLVRGECDDDTVTEDFLVCAASLSVLVRDSSLVKQRGSNYLQDNKKMKDTHFSWEKNVKNQER